MTGTDGTNAPAPSPALPAARLSAPALFADRVLERHHRREDLIDALLSVLGIATMWLLGLYAHSTTEGVTQDVLRVNVIRDILLLPVTFVEGMIVLTAPIAIMVALARRRRLVAIVESILTATVAGVLGLSVLLLLQQLPTAVTSPLRVQTATGSQIGLNVVIIALAALFTAAGETTNMRTVRYAWWGLWIVTFLRIARGSMSLPGALISILLGRAIGSAARWILGFEDRRATGVDLVGGLLAIGIVPRRVIRSDLDTSETPLTTWIIDEDDPDAPDLDSPEVDLRAQVTTRRPLRQCATSEVDPTDYTVTRHSVHDGTRHYQVWDEQDGLLDLVVVDPGRELTGTAVELWNNLRLRGISRWISPSLKANAERAMLTSLSALRAGVRVPEPLGLSQGGDSVLVVHRAMPPAAPLRDLPPDLVTDGVLDEVWRQLVLAHSRAIAHRDLGFDSVMLDGDGQVWLTGWEQGEVAASELNQRIDVAQLLVHLAVCVGPERALDSARRIIGEEELRACAPVLQNAVLPTPVNTAVRRTDLVSDLRSVLVSDSPTGTTPQLLNIQRFSVRTVIMVAILVIALLAVFGSMNFSDVAHTVMTANPLWIVIAFLVAALTWIGGAIPLVALSPEKIRLGDATLAQIAASIVTVVAPAGIGPAALNLRFLNKQKVSTPLAVTTVTLQQISQFLTTVVMLLIVIVFTGNSGSVSLPYSTILAVVAALIVAVGIATAIPKLRHWIWEKVEPTWMQVYPRLLWVVGQPRRVAAVVAGNLLMNVGFIGAFGAALAAFSGHLDITTLAITYLVSNSVGSVVPSPGGIGPVETALISGLQVAGVPASIAFSTALLYRLVTFYGRIPFGWAAMKVMQKKDLL